MDWLTTIRRREGSQQGLCHAVQAGDRAKRSRLRTPLLAPSALADTWPVRTMPDEGRTNLEATGRMSHPLESARMPPPAPMQNERRSALVFWSLCILAGPPIAFATAAAGFPIVAVDPLRDIALIALASVAEEIVFRGFVQPALARWFERRSGQGGRHRGLLTPANATTSLLFATLHLWGHPLVVAAAIFPISLAYGRARELSGRTWPAAALHVYFNLLLYAASWLLASAR